MCEMYAWKSNQIEYIAMAMKRTAYDTNRKCSAIKFRCIKCLHLCRLRDVNRRMIVLSSYYIFLCIVFHFFSSLSLCHSHHHSLILPFIHSYIHRLSTSFFHLVYITCNCGHCALILKFTFGLDYYGIVFVCMRVCVSVLRLFWYIHSGVSRWEAMTTKCYSIRAHNIVNIRLRNEQQQNTCIEFVEFAVKNATKQTKPISTNNNKNI